MTRVLRKLLAPAVVGVALVAPSSAAAQGVPCWRQVIDDWWDNGRVDRVYEPRCYREALARLPEDMQAYSDAPDAIERALREAIRLRSAQRPQGEDGRRTGQAGPPPRTGPPDSGFGRGDGGFGGGLDDRFSEGGGRGTPFRDAGDGSEDFDDFDSRDGNGSGGGSGGGGGGGGGGGDGDRFVPGSDPRSDAAPRDAEPPRGVFREALDRIGPNDPSSFPLPLLILAAIALLLLTLATAGFLSRRLHARGLRLFGR